MKQKDTFGDMVRAARKAKGWTMQELGDLIDLSKGKVYDIEKGRTRPTDVKFIRLLSYHLEADVEVMYAAAVASHNRWNEADQVGLELLSSHIITKEQEVDEKPLKAKKRSRKQIQNEAEALVMKLFRRAVEEGTAIPVMSLYDAPNFIEMADSSLPVYRTGRFAYSATEKIEGRTYRGDDAVHIELRDDVYSQAVAGQGRARFSAAHELAHAVLHHEMLGECVMFRDSTLTATTAHPNMKPFENPEWQANVWAAAFLMPEKGVRVFLEELRENEDDLITETIAQEVAARFKVSLTAAHYRIQELFFKGLTGS